MSKAKRNSALQNAERFGGYTRPAILDREEEALQAEFAGLDLTEAEVADLGEAWRLRRPGATNSERIASRHLIASVRASLDAAVEATIAREGRAGDRELALQVFEADELRRRERHEIALLRPNTDAEIAFHQAKLKELAQTANVRRQAVADRTVAGGKIVAVRGTAARQVLDRDGLLQLFERSRITRRQLSAGVAYRRRVEAVSHGLRSPLGGLGSGGPQPTPEQLVKGAMRLARWEQERVRCEIAVVRRLRGRPMALGLLRRVAGEGFSITSQAGSGRANGAAIEDLCAALDVVADVLPAESV